MEINHFNILGLMISLSCLFSFSASTSAPSPLSSDISVPFGSPASAPSSFDVQYSFSFPEPEGEKPGQTFSILPGNIDPTLQRICGDTDHPIECLITTVPFLGEIVAIEPVSILKVGIEAMNNKTKEALAKATRLVQDPSTPKHVASCLETCIDSYNAILDSDQKVLDAISIRDLYQLSMELSSNVENVHACEDAFEEADIESPIKEMDLLLGKMISNSLAIGVDLVHF
ncbi:uncharacterized protein LOC111283882 [Durio zibethinus]|uniref:Uncharacterized protein LOC111283882 n=1 Tax=Durio zibethinus TaxID=66656 RepID=A0A6P5XJ97_DURZI|nr:uncharacterized protein LOC111283882 [Durio zibethinus]